MKADPRAKVISIVSDRGRKILDYLTEHHSAHARTFAHALRFPGGEHDALQELRLLSAMHLVESYVTRGATLWRLTGQKPAA